jgi:hypothetical protein
MLAPHPANVVQAGGSLGGPLIDGRRLRWRDGAFPLRAASIALTISASV